MAVVFYSGFIRKATVFRLKNDGFGRGWVEVTQI
jgi:hypothetical protein